MKLSEAALLGNMALPRTELHLMDGGKACFLGGALLSIGAIELGTLTYGQQVQAYARLVQEWPFLNTHITDSMKLPHSFCPDTKIQTIIWWLNDTLKWTRPQIAAWVASIESSEPTLPSPTTHEVVAEGQEAQASRR